MKYWFSWKINYLRPLFLFLITCSNASFEDKPLAARPAAMGGAYAALSNDSNAAFFNPAGLNMFSATTLSFSQVSLYNESDLKYSGLGLSVPTLAAGSFGFNYASFGASYYKENEIIFTHSFMLAPGAYFGYNIRQQKLAISGAGSAAAMSLDAGAIGSISPALSIGIYSRGINRPTLAGEDTYRELAGGVCYRPFRGMLASLDWTIPADRTDDIMKLGVEMNVLPSFCVRFGAQPSLQRASFGFGLMLKYLDIDYAFVTHETLDNEHLFSVALRWGEKRETAAPTKYYKPAEKKKPLKGGTAELTDINEAEVAEFDALPGIGKVTAVRIVEYRNNNGPFKDISDLMNVPKFSKKQFDKIKDYITVGAPPVGKGGKVILPAEREEKLEEEGVPEDAVPAVMTEEDKIKFKKKYYFEGLKLYQAKKYREAIEVFNKILKIDPSHPQSLRIIEKCENALGNK